MDALPLNLRLRKGGIPYPRLKMNINSSDLCSRVTRYWALSNRISDMGDAPSITKHAFGIRTHEVVVFQTSLLGKWVQVSILKNIASVCACCNKFKYQSSTIQLYIIFKMMWSGNFHANYIDRASRSRTQRLDRFRGHAHLSCSLGHATHLHCLRQF